VAKLAKVLRAGSRRRRYRAVVWPPCLGMSAVEQKEYVKLFLFSFLQFFFFFFLKKATSSNRERLLAGSAVFLISAEAGVATRPPRARVVAGC